MSIKPGAQIFRQVSPAGDQEFLHRRFQPPFKEIKENPLSSEF